MIKNKIEILGPAGSMESMYAAFNAGADAVYMGGSKFGARAFAENPDESQLKYAIDYAHIHGKKIYLALNTLLKERELEEEVYDFLKPYYEEGLDGIIIQDLGLLAFLKENFPELPLHASTQMTISGLYTARWLESQGMERIVLPREMSLDEIRMFSDHTNMDLEVFVQGALCYSYSGQCLMSSMIGGRSGNRGRCAQPCRLPYQADGMKNAAYLLSPKDICTLSDIPDLVDAGANSFKIEGRMKKPEYAALTVWLYRNYVDRYLEHGKEKFKVDQKDVEKLMDLYNRGGFSGGYLHCHNAKEMIYTERPNHMGVKVGSIDKNRMLKAEKRLSEGDVLEVRDSHGTSLVQWTLEHSIAAGTAVTPKIQNKGGKNKKLSEGLRVFRVRNNKLIKELHEQFQAHKLKEKIHGTLTAIAGEPLTLTVGWGDLYVTKTGHVVQTAERVAMDEAQLEKPLRKTGQTSFTVDELDIYTDHRSFVPNQELNELRRNALEELEQIFLKKYKRQIPLKQSVPKTDETKTVLHTDPVLNVMFSGKDTMQRGLILADQPFIQRVYIELNESVHDRFKTAKAFKEHEKEVYFSLPLVMRKDDVQKVKEAVKQASVYADGFLVHQIESIMLLKEILDEPKVVLDQNIYVMNRRTKALLQSFGAESMTASAELNQSELKNLGCSDFELVGYGHQQMMVSAQCIKKTRGTCDHCQGLTRIRDRQNKYFYIYHVCDYCYNVIYNGVPTMLLDKKKALDDLSPKALRIHFTVESEKEMRAVYNYYKHVYIDLDEKDNILKEFTRGHFTRGVD